MLHEIFGYFTHHIPALCWGFGFGLMIGTVLVAIGAARQYEKGHEDGFEQGIAHAHNEGFDAGYDVGFAEGFEHINDYESPLMRGEGSD